MHLLDRQLRARRWQRFAVLGLDLPVGAVDAPLSDSQKWGHAQSGPGEKLTSLPLRRVLLLKKRRSLQRPQGPLHLSSRVCLLTCSVQRIPVLAGVALWLRRAWSYLASWLLEKSLRVLHSPLSQRSRSRRGSAIV